MEADDYADATTTPGEPPSTATATKSPLKSYEEYFVEHATAGNDSRRILEAMILNKSLDVVPPYCAKCSNEELAYCRFKVVFDHCCCDKKYNEVFSWVPHTCYMGPQPCALSAKDCETYEIIRDCCCNKILKKKWSKTNPVFNSEKSKKGQNVLIIFLVFVMVAMMGIFSP